MKSAHCSLNVSPAALKLSVEINKFMNKGSDNVTVGQIQNIGILLKKKSQIQHRILEKQLEIQMLVCKHPPRFIPLAVKRSP